ncbi:MAG TPA: aspartate--tRNA(Asn) ligase [Candidatus Nanopusillus sp.]|nr:aspartate--tRNA(Asn) ligase [Candidatus Nanopusillus sp.]
MKLYAKDLQNYLNKEVIFAGWVHSKRILGKIAFIILRDKTGFLQATFKKDILKEKFHKVKHIQNESVVKVMGTIQEKVGGGYEILVKDFSIINESEPLPIEIWNPDIKTQFIKRIQYRPLDLRRPETLTIFKIRNSVIQYFREYLLNKGFIESQTPKIVLMGAESGADVFKVDYFRKTAYLAQSPQLYKQMLMASGIDQYFEFGWYWRAEKSHTSRHLTEFYGLDVEMAWINDHYDILDFVGDMLKYVLKRISKSNKESLDLLGLHIDIPKSIPRISLKEAYKILGQLGKKLKYGSDLDSESERLLGKYFMEEYNEPIVFITNYPWSERPFYHMRLEEDPFWTKSFDIFYKGLEISTGAQREHRFEVLLKQAKEKNVPLEPLKYYLETFKYGMPPHGGFGLGIDRFVKQLLDLKDIREAVLWFRDPEHLSP